jgi:uncharacterized protein
MIFVDSGAWYALLVMNDSNHQAAEQWFDANNERLITSDYILDESLTLLRTRGLHHQASMLGQGLLANRLAELVYLKIDIVEATWEVFQQYNDKQWSFTDCTSKVLMERMHITTAFAFDHHFRQFGTVGVVP